jgi:hypothetical protein
MLQEREFGTYIWRDAMFAKRGIEGAANGSEADAKPCNILMTSIVSFR